ncbi:alpha/beta fold hydrolase [Conexibacter sp. SYSU D00693]|uniref:alpha/beta fold hydrolase n=1 Tax=Conexibacter sp. SYSU D00693 TaxID=2812560 RepID=UPI00196B3E16|nr:alpha/beta fold hydrolase [Conexibacter sp. SYSU D00693]
MPEELDLHLPAGRLHAVRHGDPSAPLVLAVHGLSANHHAFDLLAPALVEDGHQVVALDLRGRGASPDTGPGTYGLPSHAADVLAAADALGHQRFALVGWSMGALITLEVAHAARQRLTGAVLVDAAGAMEEDAVVAVRAGLDRLDAVVDDPAQYVEAIRAVGAVTPWHALWETYFAYELAQGDDGRWRARTSKAAALEDLEAAHDDHRARWPALTMPSLLVRCTVPLGGGLLVPEIERDGLQAAAAQLQVLEVAENHYGVMVSDAFVRGVRAHLAQARDSVPGEIAVPET